MVQKLCKSVKIFCLGIALATLLVALPPTGLVASSSDSTKTSPTAILCLVGSFCGDIHIRINV